MALILDLIAELGSAQALEKQRVDGGSDLIDTAQGQSTLTAETLSVLQTKLQYETEQLALITAALAALKALEAHGYPDRTAFDVDPKVAEELAVKQKQMQDFANELRPIIIGADAAIVTERAVEPVIETPTKKAKK